MIRINGYGVGIKEYIMIKQHKGFHELRTNEIFHYSVGTDHWWNRPLVGLTDSQKNNERKVALAQMPLFTRSHPRNARPPRKSRRCAAAAATSTMAAAAGAQLRRPTMEMRRDAGAADAGCKAPFGELRNQDRVVHPRFGGLDQCLLQHRHVIAGYRCTSFAVAEGRVAVAHPGAAALDWYSL